MKWENGDEGERKREIILNDGCLNLRSYASTPLKTPVASVKVSSRCVDTGLSVGLHLSFVADWLSVGKAATKLRCVFVCIARLLVSECTADFTNLNERGSRYRYVAIRKCNEVEVRLACTSTARLVVSKYAAVFGIWNEQESRYTYIAISMPYQRQLNSPAVPKRSTVNSTLVLIFARDRCTTSQLF